MKATLYDALGILPTSSDEEVRAALRGQIRKYYAKTRDGQGNVEEALRFINHASRILSDSERRERYDEELLRSNDDDVSAIARSVLLGDDADSEVGRATGPGDAASRTPSIRNCPVDTPDVAGDPPSGPDRAGCIVRSLAADHLRTLCALRCLHRGRHRLRRAADLVVVARSVLGSLATTLLVLTAIYGVVHGIVSFVAAARARVRRWSRKPTSRY